MLDNCIINLYGLQCFLYTLESRRVLLYLVHTLYYYYYYYYYYSILGTSSPDP